MLIEIKGGTKGQMGELVVLLEYTLMQNGFNIERGPVYAKGLNDIDRANILKTLIGQKSKLQEAKQVTLEVNIQP